MILLSSFVTGSNLSLRQDLGAHYSFNNLFLDSSPNNNDAVNDVGTLTINTTAKIGNGSVFNNAGDNCLDTTFGSGITHTDGVAYNFWIRSQTPNGGFGDGNIMAVYDPSATGRFRVFGYVDGNLQLVTLNDLNTDKPAGADIDTGDWFMITHTYDGSTHTTCVNGISRYTSSPTNVLVPDHNHRLFCREINSVTSEYSDTSNMDEVTIWERGLTLDDSTVGNACGGEVAELYNNGTGLDMHLVLNESATSVFEVAFFNNTNISKTVFNEEENFRIVINHTTSNGSIVFGDACNVTMFEGITETIGINDNFSLCAGGACDINTEFNETFNVSGLNLEGDDGLTDIVEFEACHINLPIGDVTVEISCSAGTASDTILASEIATCPNMFPVRTESNICVNDTVITVNLTVTAPFTQRKLIENLEYEREYTRLTVGAGADGNVYNTSEFHHFRHGTKTVHSNCTSQNAALSDSSEDTMIIVNIPPVVFNEGILIGNSFSSLLINNSVIEFLAESYQFLFSIIDDDLLQTNHTLLCNNGSVIFDVSHANISHTENVTFLDMVDFVCNPYTLSTTALDTNNNITRLTTHFNITDTTNPVCTGLNNASVTVNTTHTTSLSCVDEFFFSFNQTCTNRPNFLVVDLNTQLYTNEFNVTVNETITCQFDYCDGHTTNELKNDWIVIVDDTTFTFRIGQFHENKLQIFNTDISLSYEQKRNKIVFTIDDIGNRVKGEPKQFTLRYFVSENSYYIQHKKYKGWIVDYDSKTWLDLNGIKEPVSVFYLGAGVWELTFITDDKKLKFESIGELNCVSGSYIITPVPVVITTFDFLGDLNADNCSTATLESVAFIILIIIFIFFLIWLNFTIIKMPALDFVIGVFIMLLGFFMAGCAWIIALIFIFVGMAYIAVMMIR